MTRNNFINEALNVFKSTLAGLPSFPRLVMYELLSYCDYPSGTISINALEELIKHDFHVKPTFGYKQENINTDTLQLAFQTIQKARPNDFKFTTNNQQIKIDMPFLRELHQAFYETTHQEPDKNRLTSSKNQNDQQKKHRSQPKKSTIFITCCCGIRTKKTW